MQCGAFDFTWALNKSSCAIQLFGSNITAVLGCRCLSVVCCLLFLKAAGRKAAKWKVQEAVQRPDPFPQTDTQPAGVADEEATLDLRSTRADLLAVQRPVTTTIAMDPIHDTRFIGTSTQPGSRQDADQDEAVARRIMAFIRRKLQGEHPSLLLLDALRSHCEVRCLHTGYLSYPS